MDLLISSGKPVREVAGELGVSAYSLYEWRRQRMGGKLKAAASTAMAPTPQEEIRRLRQQVAYLERQREILKKAIAICSKESWLEQRRFERTRADGADIRGRRALSSIRDVPKRMIRVPPQGRAAPKTEG